MTLTLTFLMVLLIVFICIYMYTSIDARQTAQRRARGHARAPAPLVDARAFARHGAARVDRSHAARARVDGRVCVTRRWVVGRARRVSSTVDGASRAIDGDGERSGVIRSSRFARARRFRSLGARDDIEVRGDGARAQGGGAERGERRGVG